MNKDFIFKLSKNKYFRNLLKDSKLLFTVLFIVIIWAFIYMLIFYKSFYESTAKILLKDMGTKEFITPLDVQSPFSTLTSAGNPLLTQIELLKSEQLKSAIYRQGKSYDSKLKLNDVKVDVKTKPNTDILVISIKGSSPENAQRLLEQALIEYDQLNLEINNKMNKSKRAFIDLKIEEINEKLTDVRRQLKDYKIEHLAINIQEESNKLVGQGITTSTKLADTKAEIKRTQSSITELENQLSLKPKAAVDAVALGSGNRILEQLRKDLNAEMQEYEYDGTKLADTNPKMVAHKNKIDAINKQIKNQIILTIGQQAKTQNINIFDPVRESLVRRLAESQSDLMGLQAEENAIRNNIMNIHKNQATIPEKKFVIDSLEQEEKVLSDAYNQLKQKQIEAKLKEAETISNVVIIDKPGLPTSASFPSRLEVIFIALMLGFIFGIITSFLKTFIEDICDDPDLVKEITGASILGAIPWIQNIVLDEQLQFMHDMAYDNIVSNLMMKCFKNNKKVISFTSTSMQKPQSAIVYQLALRLKKFGHSVIVLDSDFRMPNIVQGLNMEDKIKINLSELIVNIEKKLQDSSEFEYKNELKSAIFTDKKNIHHIGNKDVVLEPYEYFGTKTFELIIESLKEDYDWVLVDCGPLQVTPEFLIISKLADGIVLFLNKTITCTVLRNITKVINDSKINIIGAIMRENNSTLEHEYEKYLRIQECILLNEAEEKEENVV